MLGSGVGAIGVVLVIIAVVRHVGGGSLEDLAFVVAAAVIALAAGAFVATGSLILTVGDDVCTIRVRALVTRRIALGDIRGATPTTVSASAYGGTGVRRAPGRPPAFFLGSGPAVLLDLGPDGAVIVQSRTPELLVAALTTRSTESLHRQDDEPLAT
jgi:hypothetical protein